MAGFSVDVSGLEGCQQTVAEEAGQFGGLADSLPPNPPGSDFGSLPSSGHLARLTAEVNNAARSELGSAQKFMHGTELALDQVLKNYMGAEAFAIYSAANAVGASQQDVKTALEGY